MIIRRGPLRQDLEDEGELGVVLLELVLLEQHHARALGDVHLP